MKADALDSRLRGNDGEGAGVTERLTERPVA